MTTELTSHAWAAIVTAIVGVLLYGVAPRLPSLLPAWFTRFVGVFTVLSAGGTLWFHTESVAFSAMVGGICLAAVAVLHVAQTREQRKAPALPNTPDASTPTMK